MARLRMRQRRIGAVAKLLVVGKIVGLTLALLLTGAAVYARGRARMAAAEPS